MVSTRFRDFYSFRPTGAGHALLAIVLALKCAGRWTVTPIFRRITASSMPASFSNKHRLAATSTIWSFGRATNFEENQRGTISEIWPVNGANSDRGRFSVERFRDHRSVYSGPRARRARRTGKSGAGHYVERPRARTHRRTRARARHFATPIIDRAVRVPGSGDFRVAFFLARGRHACVPGATY